MENASTETRKRPSIWLFVSIVLVIVCAILAWKLVSYKSEITTLTVEKTGLTEEKANLIAQLEKLEKEYDQLSEENSNLSEMFEKEKAHVQKLIEQIRNAEGSLSKYKKQVTQLEGRLKEYEDQLEKLKNENKALVEENFDIKTALDSTITENVELVADKIDLTEQVEKGSVLTAYDLIADGIKATSKKEIPTLKAKKAEKIRVTFTIGENAIATPGQKDVYVRIADPQGNIMVKGTGDELSFDFEGNKLQYSLKETINYQNKPIDLLLYWDKTGEFLIGTYTVDVFVEGHAIGTCYFKFEK